VNRDRNRTLKVLLNGGPTRAYLDDVRYLSNFSSGGLAFEIARALKAKRIDVAAVIGPTSLDFSPLKLRRLKNVETIEQMRAEMLSLCKSFRPDVVIFSAAVLDFIPKQKKSGKVSSRGTWTIELKPSPKIIDEVARKFPRAKRIGFKLQWEKKNPQKFGAKLLEEKGLHGLVLNYLPEIKKGSHPALLFTPGKKPFPAKTKREIARWISDLAEELSKL